MTSSNGGQRRLFRSDASAASGFGEHSIVYDSVPGTGPKTNIIEHHHHQKSGPSISVLSRNPSVMLSPSTVLAVSGQRCWMTQTLVLLQVAFHGLAVRGSFGNQDLGRRDESDTRFRSWFSTFFRAAGTQRRAYQFLALASRRRNDCCPRKAGLSRGDSSVSVNARDPCLPSHETNLLFDAF